MLCWLFRIGEHLKPIVKLACSVSEPLPRLT